MSKQSEPLHMRDVDDDVPVLPANITTSEEKNAMYVDVKEEDLDLSNASINYGEYVSSGKGLKSLATIGPDGQISLTFDLKQHLPDLPTDHAREVKEFAIDQTQWRDYPSMNIVIMIVGSRGDVQPYVALGKVLLKDGHRVRIASHETFRSFVLEAGLEFFSIGGNPQELMSYMVKNPGLMPGFESLTNGDIKRKRTMLAEMINGCWLSCHSPCTDTGRTFAVDAIISNPPTFAHIHCAEALGIPLLMSFTMPWSPTAAFSHPLVNITNSNAGFGLSNYLSYAMAEILTWQGVGDVVNNFRTSTLGLQPLTLRSGPGLVDRLKVPWTYCMSPALVPKPDDWMNHIDVIGFYFLDLASNYRPPEELATFLAAGEAPVYIGFGSVVVDDPAAMSKIIFDATKQAGVRALVSAGWGGLGGLSVPPHVFILGNVPHDWLFDNERVSAVVHHGGAGTTAVGLAKGRPTVVVPFFGDQGFWGNMIHKAGAGPKPIPHKELAVDNLRDAITFAISPPAREAARQMAQQIHEEDGVNRGVDSFYRHLPLLNMRCDLDPSRMAIWWSTEHCMKLSAFAAQTLSDAKRLDMNSLDLHRTKEYDTTKKVSDPVSGGANAIFWTVTHYYAGIAEIFYRPVQGIIHTTTAIPQGIMKIVFSVHEGFQNVPELYGSKVRKPGKVTGFTSGLKEGGKSIFYGYYDGITGLIKEPVQGAKKEGFIGAIKGSARSFVNVTMRPAAGIMGFIAYPLQGAWKSMQSEVGRTQENRQHLTRLADGKAAVQQSSPAQRAQIIERFNKALRDTPARRKHYMEAAERAMFEDMDLDPHEIQQASKLTSQTGNSDISSTSTSSTSGTPTPPTTDTASADAGLDEDATFLKELEMAKRLSLAEYQEKGRW